ncbi:MAG TPA: peptidase domain-containing ABC transporter [Vicinamibacteria bacterium]|nr:peptidase domain-containing ABC transporter [Vicinamibacteria bacterium]
MPSSRLRHGNGHGATLPEPPILKLLPQGVRALVANSFVPTSFPFGGVIAREGDEADALYLLVSGRARVLKRGEAGEEIPLNFLQAGDTFGEMALIEGGRRTATVRASGEVLALRLDRSVFEALLRVHPEIRAYFELQVKHRKLQNLFRRFPAFARLPADAVTGIVMAQLQVVNVEPGEQVVRQGDPPGPLYLVEDGHLRVFRHEGGRRRHLQSLGPGDFFGEMSVFRNQPRAAGVEAVSPSRLLALSEPTYRQLLRDVPGFQAQMEEQIARSDYKRIAAVPADFAEEILPAESDRSKVEADPSGVAESAEGADEPFAQEGRFVKRARRVWRFPLVWQIDEMDCGAACLAMVCRHFGRAVSLARIRQLVHTSLDGTSLRAIGQAAVELGLAARSVKVSPRNLERMPLPAILHWEGNHWVVLYEVTGSSVRVADPALGLRRFKREELLARWSGYAALFDYTDAFAHAPVAKPSLAWLWPFVRPHTGLLLRSLGLAGVVSALQMVLPVFSQVIVDRVLVERDVSLLNLLIGSMAVVMAFMIVALGAQRYLLSFVAVRVDAATLDFLTRRLLALPVGYFAARRTGDIQRRLDGVRQLRDFLVQHGVAGLTAAVQILASLVLMFAYSPRLALVFLATAPVYGVLMRVSARVLRPIFDRLEEAFGKYRSYQIDAIKGIDTVKALGGEDAFRALMLAQFQGVARRLFRSDFTALSYEGAIQAVTFLTTVLFLWVGAHQVMAGELSIGGLVAFNSLVALANAPIVTLLGLWDNLQRSAVLVDRLSDVFENEPEQGADRSRLRPVRELEGHISFRGLGFRYGGPESPAILEDIRVDIAAGQRIALVGRSGCGKTTLARCMAGLLEPTEGTILYDGLDLKTLNYRDLRRRIGFVLQDNHLFADTIARNIAFGEDEPDMERVVWAAGMANSREFVERLPLAYETRVGETGIALSGGQRQRIAIARALYRRPPLLILDEATSALDSESERVVQENMDTLLEGRTSIVIAHRLSTIRNADLILVLEKGRLVEKGTHVELLERQGLYYYLASQQLVMSEGA